jgi:hypothetical protein
MVYEPTFTSLGGPILHPIVDFRWIQDQRSKVGEKMALSMNLGKL